MHYTLISFLLAALAIFIVFWHVFICEGGLSTEKNIHERRSAVLLSWGQMFLGTTLFLYHYRISDIVNIKYVVYVVRALTVAYFLLYFNYWLILKLPFLIIKKSHILNKDTVWINMFGPKVALITMVMYVGFLFIDIIQNSENWINSTKAGILLSLVNAVGIYISSSLLWLHKKAPKGGRWFSKQAKEWKDWLALHILAVIVVVSLAQFLDGTEDRRWLILDMLTVFAYTFNTAILEFE